MAGNSPKPEESTEEYLSALSCLVDWLRTQPPEHRCVVSMAVLAERTLKALENGQAPESIDVGLFQQAHEGQTGAPSTSRGSKWLSQNDFAGWWRRHRGEFELTCAKAGWQWMPNLVCPSKGGGRGNQAHYRLSPVPVTRSLADEPAGDQAPASGNAPSERPGIRYYAEPAAPSLLSYWIPAAGFPVRSWRSLVVLLIIGVALAAAVAVILLTAWLLWSARGVHPQQLVLLSAASLVLFGIRRAVLPIWRLPERKLIIAPGWMLGHGTYFGQLQLERGGRGRVPSGGWVSLVRWWAPCPICAGEVDLVDGDPVFPGRLVGRCADSPAEHVYSFDPVGGVGISLHDQPQNLGPR